MILNLSKGEEQALAMLLDAAVTNAASDDDAAVLERIRLKLSRPSRETNLPKEADHG